MEKTVIEKKEFNVGGDFESMFAAQSWLRENGYDYGTIPNNGSSGVVKGSYYDYDLPFNMDSYGLKHKEIIHGIIRGDIRNGPVIVELYE